MSVAGDTDLDAHARVACSGVDRGEYEFGIDDYNCDQMVNLADFLFWKECMTGPDTGPHGEACEPPVPRAGSRSSCEIPTSRRR